MKKIINFLMLLLMTLLVGGALQLSAQNDLQIKGYVYSGSTVAPNWPVYIVNLAGTPSFSATVYTNTAGFYSSTVSGGAASPNKQWKVSTYDQCTGLIVADTVTNCNGANSSALTDMFIIRTDTSLSSCVTGYVTPTFSSPSWTLSNWSPSVLSVNYTVTNFNVTASNASFGKQELCSSCSSPFQSCFYANIFGDNLRNDYHRKYYDAASDMLFVTGRPVGNNDRLYLLKIDRTGNIIFSKQYITSTAGGGGIVMAPNGDLLLGGMTASNQLYMIRVDSNGNVIWSKNYVGSGDRYPTLIKSTGDSYIMVSWYGGSSGDDVAFMKIDGSGNILWQKRLNRRDDQLTDATSNGNGGCLFTGNFVNNGVGIEAFFGEMDANGNLLWSKEINGSNAETPRGFRKTLDGGYTVTGRSGAIYSNMNNGFFMKLNSSFGITWVKRFSNFVTTSVNMPAPAIQDNYGNYYIGASTTLTGSNQGHVLKFDVAGNFIWSKTLDYIGVGNTSFFELFSTNGAPESIFILGSSSTHPVGTGAPCSPGYTDLYTCNVTCNASFTYTTQQSQYVFINTSTGSNLSYSWNFGDGTTSTLRNPIHTFAAAGTYNVCLVVLNSSGCQDVFCSTIQVQTLCQVSYTYSSSGNTVQFSSAFSGVTSAYNFFWTFGDGSTSVLANPLHIYSSSGVYNVCVTLTETNGCQSVYCDSVYITNSGSCNAVATGNPGLYPSPASFPPIKRGCSFSEIIEFENMGDSVFGVILQWLRIDSIVGLPVGISYNVQPDNFFYPFEAGCINLSGTTNSPQGSYPLEIWVTAKFNILPNPISIDLEVLIAQFGGNIDYNYWVNVTSGNCNQACNASFTYTSSQNTVFFQNTSTGSNLTYSWYITDGSSYNVQNPVHVFQSPGTYDVLLKVFTNSALCDSVWQSLTISAVDSCSFTYTSSQDTFFFQSNSPAISFPHFWDFGDGSSIYSYQNPVHIFQSPGTYNVCLTDHSSSCGDTICQTITVPAVNPCPVASFTYTVSGDTVFFQNTSSGGIYWEWNLGDGTVDNSTLNPVHVYLPGTYTVQLTLWPMGGGGCFADTVWHTITVTPTVVCTASFAYSSSQSTFRFTSLSTGNNLTYNWDFGDGFSASLQNPTYTFASFDSFLVCLTVSDSSGCSDTHCEPVDVLNSPPCNASFMVIDNGNQFGFLNTSTNVNSYTWDFGDGSPASSQLNSSHTYPNSGNYNVCLAVSNNSACQDTFCDSIVVVQSLCNAAFTYTVSATGVSFTNNSTSSQASFSSMWDFGDGTTDTVQHPLHVYTNMGSYTVCLTISDSLGCTDTYCDSVTYIFCTPDFAYTVNGYTVTFTNTSVPLQNLSTFWSFGENNATSMQPNPSYTYSGQGVYQVCLTIIDNSTGCINNICRNILISPPTQQFYCISGRVTKGNATNAAEPATVYLIYNDTLLGTLTAIATTATDSNGNYTFCNIPIGRYIVKAALNSGAQDYSNYVPTYFGNSLFWNYATEIVLNHNFQQINIWLIAGSNPGGPGFVGGYVSQGANKMMGPGDPVQDVQVMLLDLSDNPLQYVYSDANGRFSFSNVAYGTYKVYAEVVGIPTYPYFVTIGPENEMVDGISILVETVQVIIGVEATANPLSSIKIYPNPAHDELFIEMSLANADNLKAIITDLAGKTVIEEILYAAAGSQTFNINLSQQQAGVYLLSIAGNDGLKTFKVVKY